ncbi:MAG: hypothetical protein JW955_13400 [Sedimentisphaerales bacterium]|nr:hypothetical protein [Sedimentisphaerales bacterium]
MRRQVIVMGIVACSLALVIGGLSIAQPPAGGPGGPGGRFDPAQMRQMMIQRMKEQLGVDDEAWKVMEPRLMKVWELNRQTTGGPGRGGMMFFGGRRNQGGGPNDRGPRDGQNRQGPPPEQQTAVDKATEQLRTTLDNEAASTEEIKKQLTALRAAREQAKQELADAQQKLREILSVRQEAQLVMMGQLP